MSSEMIEWSIIVLYSADYMFYWRTKLRLGMILKKIRKERGYSQESISFDISIDRRGLSLLENGKTNPTLFILVKLCRHLHIKLWKVLKEINI